MRIDRTDVDVLQIRDVPVGIAILFTIFAGGVALGVYKTIAGHGPMSDWFVVGAAALIGTVVASVMLKRTSLTFDRRRKELAWTRRGIFERAGGVVEFDALRGAQVQWLKLRQTPSHRVAVILADGTAIPLSASYSTNDEARCRSVADEVNAFLGVPPLADAEHSFAGEGSERPTRASKLKVPPSTPR